MYSTTARGALAELDNFFSSTTVSREERKALWNVLSALRGPDGFDNKDATVGLIRTKAFPKTAASYSAADATGATFITKDSDYYVSARTEPFSSSHFREHVMRAFLALGLSWDTDNDAPAPPQPASDIFTV